MESTMDAKISTYVLYMLKTYVRRYDQTHTYALTAAGLTTLPKKVHLFQ